MTPERLVHVAVFPGWIAAVTDQRGQGYQCWVVNPDLVVLNDGELYLPQGMGKVTLGERPTSGLDAARYLV